ncbi:hypothetical protein [Rubellimicrobium arenae]|nr:hypothetical protein [Rubellimicrobium arenae]
MQQTNPVMGVHAPSPRLTPLGALLIAMLTSLPVGAILSLAAWLWG